MPEHLKLVTEETAIRLCLKHRDPSGFEFLVRKFRREAYYHAHALLGNEPDAADACRNPLPAPLPPCPGCRSWIASILGFTAFFAIAV